MNTDDARFDRLVDEELNEEERRQLLGRLDDEPDGWRRCALAFLEAQCWKQTFAEMPSVRDSLSAVFQPAETKAGETPPLRESTRRSPWLGRLSTISAMAASFLVALWLGSAAHNAWVGRQGVSDGIGTIGQFAGNTKAFNPVVEPVRSNGGLAISPKQSVAATNPWHVVTVSAPSDGRHPQATVNVPAVERDNVDEQWVKSLPPAIPDNVLQALARTGHQVQQRRELVPVPLKDGRRLVVPVDQVDVHYIGNGPY